MAWENSAQDKKMDRREMKKRGMKQSEWEGSPADKRMDQEAKMGSEMKSLYRQGMISGDQWNKLSASTGGSSLKQKGKMANFDDRSGTRDQGGIRDRGDAAAGNRHIDKNQAMVKPAMGLGKPSRAGNIKQPREVSTPGPVTGGRDSGGAANAYGQPAGRSAINQAQTPAFPYGARKGPDASNPPSPKGAPNRKFVVGTGKRAKGPGLSKQTPSRIRSSGPQYGGPNSQKNA